MIDRNRIFELRPGTPADRRQHPRIDLARACKLRIASAVNYRPAVTRDVSAGGIYLQVDGSDPVEIGARALLAISWHGHPTVTHGETIPARVVRVEQGEDTTSIALEFDAPIAIDSVLRSDAA